VFEDSASGVKDT